MSKVIVLDYGIYMFRSINALRNNPTGSAPFTCMSMIIGNLKLIGVDKDDIIIVAVDYMRSWRKKFLEEYKENRQVKREEDKQIDWKAEFKKMNKLLDNIQEATNFHVIKIVSLEADDIMAICCRYYKDKEVILCTYDEDLTQMFTYKNVKMFSQITKRYKIPPKNHNPYAFIASKIKKQVKDNIVSPILNKADYDARQTIADLLTLPKWIEDSVQAELGNIEPRELNLDLLWSETLRERFPSIYKKEKVETYEKSVKFYERKEKKIKKGKCKVKCVKKED